MASNNSYTLVDEKLAVSLFLDSLLRETEILPEIETVTEPVAKQILEDITPVVDIEISQQDVSPELKAELQTIDALITSASEIEVDKEVVIKRKEGTALDSIIPEWANEPFQVLLFDVAGLKLAVPLVELSAVIEWKESVTEMPGHADFYMGILQHLDNKIAVIDTARMVLPVKKLAQIVEQDPRKRVHHIVLIDDYRWGLACDKIGEVITLNPDDVRWRTSKTSRGWLAGTVIEHMCALLNSEGFSAMIAKGHTASD